MKNLFLFLASASAILLTSCQGDPGPQGDPGVNILGQVFEVTVDFNQANNFSDLITFPSNVEVFESDVVLVYRLEGSVDGNGGPIDIWSQLPQTFFPPQGTLLYTFDHTFLDVNILLDGNFDLNSLGPDFTNNQTFRIAIVPAEFATADLTMDQLLELFPSQPTIIERPGN